MNSIFLVGSRTTILTNRPSKIDIPNSGGVKGISGVKDIEAALLLAPGKYRFSRHKAPKDFSYPIKRSEFDASLEASGVTSLADLVLYFSREPRGTMTVTFIGEQCDAILRPGTFSLWIYAVPFDKKTEVMKVVLDSMLPSAFQWMLELERAGNVRRDGYHHWVGRMVEGKSVIESD